MTVFEECGREMAVAFAPIILAIVTFGAFRFWQVFLRKPGKGARR